MLNAVLVERRVDGVQDNARILRRIVPVAVVDAVQTGGERMGAVRLRGVKAKRQAGQRTSSALDTMRDPVRVDGDNCAGAHSPRPGVGDKDESAPPGGESLFAFTACVV